MIPANFIDEVLARADIATVIDRYVKLQKKGKNYKACCPFHDERSPSFTVNVAKQFYYCFGCGASGDAVSFLMDYECIDFPTAVKKLAHAAGLAEPDDSFDFDYAKAAKEREARRAELMKQQEADDLARQVKVSPLARMIWDFAKAEGVSQYLARKQVGAYGIRILPKTILAVQYPDKVDILTGANIQRFFNENNLLPEDERLTGQKFLAGSLVVPAVDHTGFLWNVQIIPDAVGHKKLFLKNAKMKGTYFLLRPVADGEPIFITEGYATGASILEAMDLPVAVGWATNALCLAALSLRKRYPNSPLILCGDNDSGKTDNPGETAAREAAQALGCIYGVPDFTGLLHDY